MRHLLFIAALISTGLLPGGEPAEATTAVVRAASPSIASVDAAMLAAVRREFPGQDVRVRLASPRIGDAGPTQREVRAQGRVLLAGSEAWIPFHVSALYDLDNATATTTSLELDAADASTRTRELDAGLATGLKTEASRKLREEFANQPVDLALARIQVREAGGYLALLADGEADFGAEGTTGATIRALYDPRNAQWVRLDYELGDGG